MTHDVKVTLSSGNRGSDLASCVCFISGSFSTVMSKLLQLGLHVLIKMGFLPVESLDDVS